MLSASDGSKSTSYMLCCCMNWLKTAPWLTSSKFPLHVHRTRLANARIAWFAKAHTTSLASAKLRMIYNKKY
jgi:hypothetical protein